MLNLSNWRPCTFVLLTVLTLGFGPAAADIRPSPAAGRYASWKNGPSDAATYFPIAVWLQRPRFARQYQALGVNLYVGLWKGPTARQLHALQAARMPVICSQNAYARRLLQRHDPSLHIVVGWAQQDEPDNAQSRKGGGYGPPVTPQKVLQLYRTMKARDPTRPVYLGLGQGVAHHDIARGVRSNHPEDYLGYVRSGDIISYDIYPACAPPRFGYRGKLWLVARGERRLVRWTHGQKRCWADIECTAIHGYGEATPHQMRAEVWMALVNGAHGIMYFCHAWRANGSYLSGHELLLEPHMRQAVAAINAQIRRLAPVLNSPAIPGRASVKSEVQGVPIDFTLRQYHGALYLFAVDMRGLATRATITVAGLQGRWTAKVLGTHRTIAVRDGSFHDAFGPWNVKLYRLLPAR